MQIFTATYQFLGTSDTRIFHPGLASANIINGSGAVNGIPISVSAMDRPTEYAIFDNCNYC